MTHEMKIFEQKKCNLKMYLPLKCNIFWFFWKSAFFFLARGYNTTQS